MFIAMTAATETASRVSSGRSLLRGLHPFATDGLGNETRLDRLGADLDAQNLPVNDGANLLNVRLERAGGDAGHLGADPAEILGLAAMGDLIPERGLLAGEITNAWHTYLKSSI